MSIAQSATSHFGGRWHGTFGTAPSPGHSQRDNGLKFTDAPGAPDNLLVFSHNGADPLAIKDELRAAGILAPFDRTRTVSPSEHRAQAERLEAEKTRREAEQRKAWKATARHALAMWNSAKQVNPDHPYLIKKRLLQAPNVLAHLRQKDGALLVPMQDQAGDLRNLQRIFADGEKRFLKGGMTQGLFWQCGNIDPQSPVAIGEGVATMATICRVMAIPVIAAMSAKNLLSVALAIRAKHPAAAIIIAADNDSHLPKNTGVECANEAARAVNGRVVIPTGI